MGRTLMTADESFWFVGPNPTVDLVVTRENPRARRREILLIQRAPNAATERGKWALPGGFIDTRAARGTAWQDAGETPRRAALRELHEETGLDLAELEPRLVEVGVYEGGGRDPRDTVTAWSRSHAFAIHVPAELADRKVAAGDDASDARWLPVDELPPNLAFDHARIIRDALGKLAVKR